MADFDKSTGIDKGNLVKTFLADPLNEKSFDGFYKLCYQIAVGYLRYLRVRGYRLPIDNVAKENPYADQAIDVLGGLLRCDGDYPYHVVFDFYKRKGIIEYELADPEELYWLLTILVRGFIKKELGKIKKEQDPAVANLKKRFKDILRGEEYDKFIGADGKSEYVFRKESKDNLRREKPPIPSDDLKELVDCTFVESKNRREWCRLIIEKLNDMTDFQNCLDRNDLIMAVVTVNTEYVELLGPRPTAFPFPDMILLDGEMEEARKQALEIVNNSVIQKYLKKSKIKEDESALFLTAADHYLTDLGRNGETDSIPEYFRQVMPADVHSLYLEKYKYVFETVVNRADKEFRELLIKKFDR